MSKDDMSDSLPLEEFTEEEIQEFREWLDKLDIGDDLDDLNDLELEDLDLEDLDDLDPDSYAVSLPTMPRDEERDIEEGLVALRETIHNQTEGSVWVENKVALDAAYESMRNLIRFFKERDAKKYAFRLFGKVGFTPDTIWFRVILPQDVFSVGDLRKIISLIPDNAKIDLEAFKDTVFVELFYEDIMNYIGNSASEFSYSVDDETEGKLTLLEDIMNRPNCNDCYTKPYSFCPKPGDKIVYNCPLCETKEQFDNR